MKFYNCVALQVRTGDLRENEANIRTILDRKPDLIELRFDYIDNFAQGIIWSDHFNIKIPRLGVN